MAGKKGLGSILAYSEDGVTYVPIANITKIKPFDAKADVIDVSAHDSPSSFREKLSGMLDAGAVTFDLNYDDKAVTHKYLLAQLGVEKFWKVTGSGGTPATAAFKGFVKALSPEYPFDNKMACSPSVEITGPITVA